MKNIDVYKAAISSDTPDATVGFNSIVTRIKTGTNELKEKTFRARELVLSGEAEAYRSFKASSLPAFTPAGRFSKREIEGLLEHSGLVVVDIDNLSDDEMSEVRERARANPHVRLLFVSPSGKGVKLIFEVSPVPDASTHIHAWQACAKLCSAVATVDESGKDVSRLCFFAYDPHLHYNPESVPVTWELPPTLPSPPPENEKKSSDHSPPTIAESMDTLKYLNASDYERWIEVGMAVKSAGLPVSVWDDWSKSASNYEVGLCEKKWESFKKAGVSWGSVIHWSLEAQGKDTKKTAVKSMPVLAVDDSMQVPMFPDTEGEHFPGIFRDLYQAFAHSHVMTAPAIMAMGLALVGYTVGRRVIVKTSELTSDVVFLNTYTLLIGRSDLTAKSDTREQLNRLLHWVCHEKFYPISDVQSIEGVIRSMEVEEAEYKENNSGSDFYTRKGYPEGSRLFVILDEIATLFANARREGTKNLLSAINKFWKCPAVERVARAKGEQIVEYPVLSVWGNITPDQVVEYLTGLDMTGGTINRFMPFYVSPKVETVRHPHPIIEHYDFVVKGLQEIADNREQRTLVFTEEADDARFEWFKAQREQQLQNEDDRGETRFHTTAVKIAGLFAVGENGLYDHSVKLSHWNDALAVTRYLIECYNYSFKQVGVSELSKIEHKILEVLNENGNEVALSELTRKTRTTDTKTRLDVLDSLQTSGEIQTYDENTGGRSRKMIRRIGN